jgi:hypothetical protein
MEQSTKSLTDLLIVQKLKQWRPMTEWDTNSITHQICSFIEHCFIVEESIAESFLLKQFPKLCSCSMCGNKTTPKQLINNLIETISVRFFVTSSMAYRVLLKLKSPTTKLIMNLYLNQIICTKCFPISQKNLAKFSILKNYMQQEELVYEFFVKQLKVYPFDIQTKIYKNVNFIINLATQYIDVIPKVMLINRISQSIDLKFDFDIPKEIINIFKKNMICL